MSRTIFNYEQVILALRSKIPPDSPFDLPEYYQRAYKVFEYYSRQGAPASKYVLGYIPYGDKGRNPDSLQPLTGEPLPVLDVLADQIMPGTTIR